MGIYWKERKLMSFAKNLNLTENWEALNVLVVIGNEIHHLVTIFPQLLWIHWLQIRPTLPASKWSNAQFQTRLKIQGNKARKKNTFLWSFPKFTWKYSINNYSVLLQVGTYIFALFFFLPFSFFLLERGGGGSKENTNIQSDSEQWTSRRWEWNNNR